MIIAEGWGHHLDPWVSLASSPDPRGLDHRLADVQGVAVRARPPRHRLRRPAAQRRRRRRSHDDSHPDQLDRVCVTESSTARTTPVRHPAGRSVVSPADWRPWRSSDEDIERVRSAVSIVDVVGQVVQLRKVGRNYVGLCPFHAERTPSFNVREETGRYQCFGCDQSGDVFTFVQELEHVDFVGAVEHLAAKVGITLTYTTTGRVAGPAAAQAVGRGHADRPSSGTTSGFSTTPMPVRRGTICAAAG